MFTLGKYLLGEGKPEDKLNIEGIISRGRERIAEVSQLMVNHPTLAVGLNKDIKFDTSQAGPFD